MTVSIIIPCFRQGRYLAEAIDSCLAQSYASVEVIVVNDGSDDNTDEVARNYKDAIRYIKKENGGVSSARNTGIAAATGAYMKFLDADDHLALEQVSWQMDVIGGSEDKVALTTIRAYEDGHPEHFTDMVPQFRSLLPDLLNDHNGATHSCLYPAKLVRAVGGFDTRYVNTQDWYFICAIGRLRPQIYCDYRVGGYYRIHPGSLSTRKELFTLETARQLIDMHDEFRDGPNRDWYGRELLGAEFRTFRALLARRVKDQEVERGLLKRLKELWRVIGPPPGASGKYVALRRLLGHRLAERVYARYCRLRAET